jgi:hypothetical protein
VLNVKIKTIPKEKHRPCAYLGDYYYKRRQLIVAVSEMGNKNLEMIVAIHELVEAHLCEQRGISFDEIDKFDERYQGDGEPGDDPKAPYHTQHKVAIEVERILLNHLGIGWQEYNDTISEYEREEDDEQN